LSLWTVFTIAITTIDSQQCGLFCVEEQKVFDDLCGHDKVDPDGGIIACFCTPRSAK
jgi:hypothetical protein